MARRTEQGPFSSLGVIDRLAYDCADPLVALAGAAAVTSRVRLVTMIVIGPVRGGGSARQTGRLGRPAVRGPWLLVGEASGPA